MNSKIVIENINLQLQTLMNRLNVFYKVDAELKERYHSVWRDVWGMNE